MVVELMDAVRKIARMCPPTCHQYFINCSSCQPLMTLPRNHHENKRKMLDSSTSHRPKFINRSSTYFVSTWNRKKEQQADVRIHSSTVRAKVPMFPRDARGVSSCKSRLFRGRELFRDSRLERPHLLFQIDRPRTCPSCPWPVSTPPATTYYFSHERKGGSKDQFGLVFVFRIWETEIHIFFRKRATSEKSPCILGKNFCRHITITVSFISTQFLLCLAVHPSHMTIGEARQTPKTTSKLRKIAGL